MTRPDLADAIAAEIATGGGGSVNLYSAMLARGLVATSGVLALEFTPRLLDLVDDMPAGPDNLGD